MQQSSLPQHRQVSATKRFGDDLATFSAAFAPVKLSFADFLSARRSGHWRTPWGKKDGPFRGPAFAGCWHAHLYYGKAILIYQITPTELRLCRVVDHLAVERRTLCMRRLVEYMAALTPADFSTYDPDAAMDYRLAG